MNTETKDLFGYLLIVLLFISTFDTATRILTVWGVVGFIISMILMLCITEELIDRYYSWRR